MVTDSKKKFKNTGFEDETTKARFIREAISLFAKRGYHATSIDDITRATGLSKGAFYWHFKSKEEILKSFLEEWESRFLDGLIQSVKEVRDGVIAKFYRLNRFTSGFAVKNRELCVSFDALSGELVGSNHSTEGDFRRIYNKYQQFLFELIEEGKREEVVRKDLDSMFAAMIIMAFHHGLLLQWSMNRENIDGETYMSTYRSILDKGIFVPHDGK